MLQAAHNAQVPKKTAPSVNKHQPLHRRKLYVKWHKTYTQCKKNPHNDIKAQQLKDLEAQIQESFKAEKKKEEDSVIQNMQDDNKKAFYKYANSKRKSKPSIGPLKTIVDKKVHIEDGPKRMADILSNQYRSVFTEPKPEKKVIDPISFFNVLTDKIPNSKELRDIIFAIGDVLQALGELNPDSSAGPDGWPAFLLKEYRALFAPHLYRMWRTSLDSGDMPDDINLAYITPIFKGGETCEPVNYRPVALTSHLTKTFERIIRKSIEHLAINNYINKTQHGFLSNRSTLTQLVEYYSNILDLLEENGVVDSIYLDFAKAFDKCDHGVILHKLRAFGITGKVGAWIHCFLTKRQQAVCVKGHLSEKVWVTSGVPQGSVLGPLLFTILISDINEGIHFSRILSYADDTKNFKGVRDDVDHTQLQTDLDTLYEWARSNNQHFHGKKFIHLAFTLSPNVAPPYFNPDNLPILSKHYVRDLGIIFSTDGSFRHHINLLVTKAKKMTAWVLRTFISRDKHTMLTLWKGLIQPIIEYCCPLWSPVTQEQIKQLERIQRSFTKKIEGMEHLSYRFRLRALKLTSSERRRERYSMIYIWNCLQNIYPNPGFHYKSIDERHNSYTLTPKYDKMGTGRMRELQKGNLMHHGVQTYNKLPHCLRQVKIKDAPQGADTTSGPPTTTLDFKGEFDVVINHLPDEPFSPRDQREHPRTAKSNSILDQIANQPREWSERVRLIHTQYVANRGAAREKAAKNKQGTGASIPPQKQQPLPSRWDRD